MPHLDASRLRDVAFLGAMNGALAGVVLLVAVSWLEDGWLDWLAGDASDGPGLVFGLLLGVLAYGAAGGIAVDVALQASHTIYLGWAGSLFDPGELLLGGAVGVAMTAVGVPFWSLMGAERGRGMLRVLVPAHAAYGIALFLV